MRRWFWYPLVGIAVFATTFYGDADRRFPIREHAVTALLWLPAAFAVVTLSGFLALSAALAALVGDR